MRITAMLAGALLLAAAPAAAQTLALRASAGDEEEARALEAEAQTLHDRPDDYARAARLYMEAAELRAEADPVRIEDQTMAGRLFYYSGDLARAQSAMEAAGNAAIRIGDVVTAAVSFLDAASVARTRKDGRSVLRLVDRARLLMESPLVDAAVKKDVLRRIEEDDAGRVSARPANP